MNRVMDALNFEYTDYDRLEKGAGGAKRKRIVSILTRQAIRSVKEDQRAIKKQKILAESGIFLWTCDQILSKLVSSYGCDSHQVRKQIYKWL